MTAEILKGVSDKLNGFARYERLATNRKALIAACEGQPNRRCDVGAYYGGASYYLQQKLEIKTCALSMRPRSASVTSAAKRTIGCGRATQATSAFIAPMSLLMVPPGHMRATMCLTGRRVGYP